MPECRLAEVRAGSVAIVGAAHGSPYRAGRASHAGCALVEFVPNRDPNGLAALLAARIALTVAGRAAARA